MTLPRPPGAPKRPRTIKPKCDHAIAPLKDASGKAFGYECSKCRKRFTRDVCAKCSAVYMNTARADRTVFVCLGCKRAKSVPVAAE